MRTARRITKASVAVARATGGDDAQHLFALTAPQEAAVEALATGRTDTDVAAGLGLNRGTVWRWRRFHPAFQAALARRRVELWEASADRLRSLVPFALDALAEELAGPDRLRAAGLVLKLAGLEHKRLPGVGDPDPQALIDREARQRADRDLAEARAARQCELDALAFGACPEDEPAVRDAFLWRARQRVLADLTDKLADSADAPPAG